MPKDRLVIDIERAQFQKLKLEKRFWQLVALSRAVNALRFVQAALLAHHDDDNSPWAMRTKFNSFFFFFALLYEALLLVERMPKHFREVPEFAPLHDILRDPTAPDLRKASFGPLRNHATFHFSEEEIGAELMKVDSRVRFMSSEGTTAADVFYELADYCALAAFYGSQFHPEYFEEHLSKAVDLALRFVTAAEKFIHAVLNAEGCKLQSISAP